jgi:hypothetical protein
VHVELCYPSSACSGTGFQSSTICAQGYTGRRCGACVTYQYYGFDGECYPCSQSSSKYFLSGMIVIVFLLIINRLSSLKGQTPPEVRIFFTWGQVIGLYPSMSNSFPTQLKLALKTLAISVSSVIISVSNQFFQNVDLEWTSPSKNFLPHLF